MWLFIFVYGGGFGIILCFLMDMFGFYNIGVFYGMILIVWLIGGVGGGLGFIFIFDRYKFFI